MTTDASDMVPALEVQGLIKRFGDLEAVAGLDLVVPQGRCQGLLGPNGAGKSTTINIIVGLLLADEGEVRVLGTDWRTDAQAIREQIGVQLQETQLFEKLTCFEALRLFRSFYRSGRDPDEILDVVGLTEKRDARYVTLSGGQKQRLSLGCSLVNDPKLLLLDEPTTGLDPQARRRVWEIVDDFKARGGTVLLTTHYMDEAEQLCDDIVIIDHGKSIAEGSPQQIIRSLGAESLIEFSIGSDTSLAQGELEQLAGVVRVHAQDEKVTLHVEATHEAVPALVGAIRDRGMSLVHLQTHRPTLEDVFVSLTGRHLRDG
ncbi:MAG: ABC transporter ATP-binding protein [Planctomycetota bacterium]